MDIILLAVLLGAGQFAAHIPLSGLSDLLIPVGFAIIPDKGFKHLRDVPPGSLVLRSLGPPRRPTTDPTPLAATASGR